MREAETRKRDVEIFAFSFSFLFFSLPFWGFSVFFWWRLGHFALYHSSIPNQAAFVPKGSFMKMC